MACFVTYRSSHAHAVYSKVLDGAPQGPFDAIRYEDDPESLELTTLERENLGNGRSALGNGYRVVPDAAPKALLWPGGRSAHPEILLYNFLAVSPRFRALVEEFEPGVHQFLPVALYKKKGAEPVAIYSWLNICNRIDSVDAGHTTHAWKTDYAGEGYWNKTTGGRFVFSRAKIGARHLWYDPVVGEGIFCSDAFAASARAADFPGLSLSEREEA